MGFGQEIKDFLGAWQAGEKIAGSGDDREYKKLRNRVLKQKADELDDPAYKGLARRKLEAQINRLNRGPRARDPELTKGRQLDNEYKAERNRLQKEGPAGTPSAADDVPTYAPPPSRGTGPRSALDVEQPYETSQLDEPEADDDEVDQQAMMAASGGAVTRRGYADGGAVEDDDEPDLADDNSDDVDPDAMDREDAYDSANEADDDEADAGGAIPTSSRTAAAPAPNAKTVAYSPEAAHDAVKGGLKYAVKETGHDTPDAEESGAIPDNARPAQYSRRATSQRAYLKGAGAASHDEMTKVAKAIDPEGKMSEAERNMASLATVYEYNLKKNDPQGADRAAASMLQYMRQVSDRYKAMSAAAASHGDLDGTIKMALRAHANVPDGQDMKLEKTEDGKIKYSMTDSQTGKVVEQTLATPEQILEYASKGSMHSFDDLLLRSAGGRTELSNRSKAEQTAEQRKKTDSRADAAGTRADAANSRAEAASIRAQAVFDQKQKKGPPGLKPADRDRIDTAITAAIGELPEGGAAIKEQLPEIRGTTTQMQVANPGISSGDALRATMEMTQIDPANPTARKFTTVGPVDGGVKFKLSNGQSIVVPDEMIPRLKAQRDANAAAATKKLEAGKASAARTGETMDAVVKAVTPGAPLTPKPYRSAIEGISDRANGAARAPAVEPQRTLPYEDQINLARRSAHLPPLPPGWSKQAQ